VSIGIRPANPQALARDAPIERYTAALCFARAVFATALPDLAEVRMNCFGNHDASIHPFPNRLANSRFGLLVTLLSSGE
jgi:hypothetical protein